MDDPVSVAVTPVLDAVNATVPTPAGADCAPW